MLEVPHGKMLASFGARAFPFGAPNLWNLPRDISSLHSLSSFKHNLIMRQILLDALLICDLIILQYSRFTINFTLTLANFVYI